MKNYKTYTIKKGRHRANCTLLLRPLRFKEEIRRRVIFSDECWYPKSEVTNSGWNKLLGLSMLFPNEWKKLNACHDQSGRFVWQPDFDNPGYIRIAAYVYGADKDQYDVAAAGWTYKEFDTRVKVNKPFDLTLISHKGFWNFKLHIGVNIKIINIFADMPRLPFYECVPYFGGRDKAYHDMKIQIKKL